MDQDVFKPGVNCWKKDRVHNATLLVDSADFYRAVHEAICRAKKTVFILGWDIDSAAKLLRGDEEKNSSEPTVLIELLSKKARENPELHIFVLIWDSSVAFVGEREFLPEYSWTNNTPENVHFHLDDTIPLWGSHHQKIILIDDELAFSGGMDLARGRWDERDHKPEDPLRTDSLGPYGPFHDVQIMMDGPMVKNFSEWVRLRWRNAADYEAPAPKFVGVNSECPVSSWPPSFPVQFKNFELALSRTTPETGALQEVQEIKKAYFDLIARAEKFIYIENQYFSSKDIAHALNKALRARPELQALLVSSYDPQGIFESEAMWANRIDFKKIVERKVRPGQVRFVSSGINKDNTEKVFKRIHSKIIIIDDLFATIGSANLTNRSMELDTECDLTLIAHNPAQRQHIASIRNDLIAEHISASIHDVEKMFLEPDPLAQIMDYSTPAYHFFEIKDDQFTQKKYQAVASSVADPKLSLMQKTLGLRNPGKVFILSSIAFVLIFIAVAYVIRTHLQWFTPESIKGFLEDARRSPWSLFIVLGIYILGGFVLFPVTLMSLLTAAVFGSIWGPIYGMTGALVSAAVMFGLGHWAGIKGTRRFLGDRIRSIDAKFRKAGVFGVTILRLIPIAPYSIVNLAAGISSVRFIDFMLGTFFGFLPAFIVKGLVGDSLTQVLLNPKKETLIYLTLGLALWMGLTVATYFFTKKWRHQESS